MRSVFFLSNRTAITAETLGHSLLAQFEGLQYREFTVPYVDSRDKAASVAQQIDRAAAQDANRPIVFSTLANPDIRALILASHGLVLDLFHQFLQPLETELEIKPRERAERSHRLVDVHRYESRMEAINFALLHDDGAYTQQYDQSDIILIGVSRSGKTPTCLYLALQFGIRAANYPITEEDLGQGVLPRMLRLYVGKLYGLTTTPERLQSIRTARRPGSRYASIEQCRYEIRAVEDLYKAKGIPFLATTTRSVEEIATRIVQERGLQRHSY
ncbi:MAG: kinase/pyrophosphorylase [Pseudomonadota bacterium]|nr:kinase/pyrophosphorylase [Pseudomonadota bacterium]